LGGQVRKKGCKQNDIEKGPRCPGRKEKLGYRNVWVIGSATKEKRRDLTNYPESEKIKKTEKFSTATHGKDSFRGRKGVYSIPSSGRDGHGFGMKALGEGREGKRTGPLCSKGESTISGLAQRRLNAFCPNEKSPRGRVSRRNP